MPDTTHPRKFPGLVIGGPMDGMMIVHPTAHLQIAKVSTSTAIPYAQPTLPDEPTDVETMNYDFVELSRAPEFFGVFLLQGHPVRYEHSDARHSLAARCLHLLVKRYSETTENKAQLVHPSFSSKRH